jgi:hypothetical protein
MAMPDHATSISLHNNGPVLPLCNPILMGVIRNNQLSLDTLLGTKVCKLRGGILTPIVRSQDLHLSSWLVLHKSLKFLEPLEDLTLGLYEIYPGLLGVVINESHILLTTTQGN